MLLIQPTSDLFIARKTRTKQTDTEAQRNELKLQVLTTRLVGIVSNKDAQLPPSRYPSHGGQGLLSRLGMHMQNQLLNSNLCFSCNWEPKKKKEGPYGYGSKWTPLQHGKSNACCTSYSQAVTHPSTRLAQHCLTSVIRREPVHSVWYGRRQYTYPDRGSLILWASINFQSDLHAKGYTAWLTEVGSTWQHVAVTTAKLSKMAAFLKANENVTAAMG